MKQLLILAAFGLFIFSCTHDDICDCKMEVKCDTHAIVDSVGIRTVIVGSWNLIEVYCPCCEDVKPEKPDKEVTAVFRSDGTYFVSEEDEIISSGEWTVQKNSMGYGLSFHDGPMVQYLTGSISLCPNELVADLTPVDGCRHTFTRGN